jgi:hypothetical protein
MAAVYNYNVTQHSSSWSLGHCSSTDLDAAPGFVNAGAFDLHLTSTARAMNLVPLSQPAPPKDIDGNARPRGTANDAGASEVTSVGSGGGTPNPPTALVATVQ